MGIFQNEDYFLLRTPYRSFEEINDLNSSYNENDENTFIEKFKKKCLDKHFQEAIYIASPDLHKGMIEWLNIDSQKLQNEKEKSKDKKIVISLYKYYVRYSTRSTPYGLFAGCATGKISDLKTNLYFSDKFSFNSHARLDMGVVDELSKKINSNSIIKKYLTYTLNTSLYESYNSYRYVEYKIKNSKRVYNLTSITKTIYLDSIIKHSTDGISYENLINLITKKNIERNIAENYINQIIDAQILVSDLEPTITGDEFFQILIKKIDSWNEPYLDFFSKSLVDINEMLKVNSVDNYVEIRKKIYELLPKLECKNLIQVDMFYHVENETLNLNQSLVRNILTKLEKLLLIDKKSVSSAFETFKKKFIDRYGDLEISLTDALDSENGIGYGLAVSGMTEYMPLLKGLSLPGESLPDTTSWNKLNQFKFSSLKKFWKKEIDIIEITDQDISLLSSSIDESSLHDSMFFFGSMYAKSYDNLDDNNFIFSLQAFYGPPSSTMLSRFCHGHDELKNKVINSIKCEEQSNPDIIYAEVAHLPDARVGNILQRPKLRDYEISYLCQPSYKENCDNDILVSDLTLSVKNNEMILKSKKHNKVVLPRLTTSHLYTTGLSVYRFLGDIQSQFGNYFLLWDWDIFNREEHLPRVSYQNIILSRERWLIKRKDLLMQEKNPNKTNIYSYLKNIFNRLKIPRHVLFVQGDNELMLDTSLDISIQILADHLNKTDLYLIENLSNNYTSVVKKDNSFYNSEILIPLIKNKIENENKKNRIFNNNKYEQYKYPPGSKWTYLKIYVGNKTSDIILKNIIKKYSEIFIAKTLIDKWFFIRYFDTDRHIRVRFHSSNLLLNDSKDFKNFTNELNSILQSGLINNFQFDTYLREIERYGGEKLIEFAEDVFFYDSEAIINFIDLIEGDKGEEFRYLFALKGVDDLLNIFEYNLEQKINFVSNLQKSFLLEFNGNERFVHKLNDHYRNKRNIIGRFFKNYDSDNSINILTDIFKSRYQKIQTLFDSTTLTKPENKAIIKNTTHSYTHMFINRMFIAKQRMHELIVYHFLLKHYSSELAQIKTNK